MQLCGTFGLGDFQSSVLVPGLLEMCVNSHRCLGWKQWIPKEVLNNEY